jgi:hypothetical protein
MLTGEELRLRKRKRLRVVLLLVIVIVIAFGVFFGARPTRNVIKGWQARRHAQKAFTFIRSEQWKEARDEAVAAYQLRQTEPAALRSVARFLSRTRQPQALEFWAQLAQHEKLTREDLRDEAAVALTAGDATRAGNAVRELTSQGEPSAADWILAAQLAAQKNSPEEMRAAIQKVFADSRASEREQFQAALLDLASARTGGEEAEERIRVAWTRIEKMAQAETATGLDALTILAQQTLSRPAANDTTETEPSNHDPRPLLSSPNGLAAALERHPLAKAPHKLLALDLLLHGHASQRDSLIDRAVADWKESDTESLTALAKWLNGKGEFQRQLDEIPQEKVLSSRELFLQHVDALGALGRWDEIRRLLESERFPLEPVLQRMYMARCNAQLGNEAAAKNNWERALEAASGDVGKLMTLAEYAEKNGAVDIAKAAYIQATTIAPNVRAAWQGQLRIVYANHETKQIHGVLAAMLALWPNDTALQNDEAYTRLLLLPNESSLSDDQELINIEKLAQNLMQREPSSFPHRTLLALSLLRQGRPVAALEVYSGIQASPNALTPSVLAVHAAVLVANGNPEAARAEVEKLALDKLLPEERALVEPLTK